MHAPHDVSVRANSRARRLLWIAMTTLSTALALFSYRYLPRLGLLSPSVLQNLLARPWLDIHIAGSATALLFGPIQFLPRLRARLPRLHRRIGRIYVAGCVVGGLGGFLLAFGTTAGPIATVGFGSLAVTWVTATILAVRYAILRRFVEHRAWMIRSFVMTYAAVTLRVLMPVAPMLGYPVVDGYRALSFLSWIPGLIIAEIYLRPGRPRFATFLTAFARQTASLQTRFASCVSVTHPAIPDGSAQQD